MAQSVWGDFFADAGLYSVMAHDSFHRAAVQAAKFFVRVLHRPPAFSLSPRIYRLVPRKNRRAIPLRHFHKQSFLHVLARREIFFECGAGSLGDEGYPHLAALAADGDRKS